MQKMQNVRQVQECLASFRAKLGLADEQRCEVGLILGTGLGRLADVLSGHAVPFAELPHFPVSTALSHAGFFSCGNLAGVPVLVQSGRCHLFEGVSASEICMVVLIESRPTIMAVSSEQSIIPNMIFIRMVFMAFFPL